MSPLATAFLVSIMFMLSVTANAQTIRTFAGGGPNNIPATLAGVGQPLAVAIDAIGNVYFGTGVQLNLQTPERVRVFNVDTSGVITVVAGNGLPGFSGDGGPAKSAEVAYPSGVTVDSAGNVFIADGCLIRRVDATTQIITTVAGTVSSSGQPSCGFIGDGGPATSAELSLPLDVAVDSAGNLFISDTGNHRIRKVTASTGIITTVAGTGTAAFSGDGGPATLATLSSPAHVALDSFGNLFIADLGNERIRKVTASTGIITTVAGNGTGAFSGDGGPAISAGLAGPSGVAVDSAGNIFIADSASPRIRKVEASTGIITTVAGNGSNGFAGDGSAATTGQFSSPMALAVDIGGNIFIADSGNSRIRKITASTDIITTEAGNGSSLFGGDDFEAAGAQVNFLASILGGVAVDSTGNVFIADKDNCLIRRVDAATQIILTVAGTAFGAGTPRASNCGFSGDGNPATSAKLSEPGGAAVDSGGNLFIADTNNCLIRRVDAMTQVITTVAGVSVPRPVCGFSGDGSPGLSAQLNLPTGVAVDSIGNLFIVASPRIRKVTASTGIITTVAGNGTNGFSGDGGAATSAELNSPNGVAVDSAGNLFIADTNNCLIRRVDAMTQVITTVAGTAPGTGTGQCGFSGDGGPATSAELNSPDGVAVDSAGNLFIADTNNCLIRRVDAMTQVITTVAGTAPAGGSAAKCFFSGDDGLATSAELYLPTGVAVDSGGNLFIADSFDLRIREVMPGGPAPDVTLAPSAVSFGNQTVHTSGEEQIVILTNGGTASLSVTAIAISGANAADFAETNTCGVAPATLAPSNGCDVNITFTPSTTSVESASLVVSDNASNGPRSAPLTGNGTDFSLGIARGSSSATITAGQTATYDLQVNSINGFTGSVTIACTGTPVQAICAMSPTPVNVTASGSAAFTVNVTTTARTMAQLIGIRRPPSAYGVAVCGYTVPFLLLLLLIQIVFSNARISSRCMLTAILLGCLVVQVGCRGSGDGVGSSGTPAGAYTLTITGAQQGVNRSFKLSLNVN